MPLKGVVAMLQLVESLKNKWWWYGHWGKDGVTCANDVHEHHPKEWQTTNSQIAEKIPKRKQMADDKDEGPNCQKQVKKTRRKLVKNPDATEANCAESSSDDDQILSKRKGKN